MNADEARELFDYDRWANARVLGIAAGLDEAALLREGRASYGSIFGTLVHILWAEWIWLTRWTTPVRTADPRSCASLAELRARWGAFEGEQRAFFATVADADLPKRITYVNTKGETWTYAFGQMLQHVANHGTYHRGQLTTMFREAGAEPKELDFLVYVDERPGGVLYRG